MIEVAVRVVEKVARRARKILRLDYGAGITIDLISF